MSRFDWVRVAMEGVMQRNGSEYIRDESERCFGSRVSKGRAKYITTTCPQCGVTLKRKILKKHIARLHGLDSDNQTGNKLTNASFSGTGQARRPKKRRRGTWAKYIRGISDQDTSSIRKPGEVRISDLAAELNVLSAIVVRRARLKGMDVDLPYHTLPLKIAEEIRGELKRRVR